jgi:hypothetical protein
MLLMCCKASSKLVTSGLECISLSRHLIEVQTFP